MEVHPTSCQRVICIDKLCTQIGNVNRLHNIFEPFAALFWALGIELAHILPKVSQPAGLASHNPSTGTVLYGRGQLGSIRLKTSRLSAISILAVLILCPIPSTRRKGQLSKRKRVLCLVFFVPTQTIGAISSWVFFSITEVSWSRKPTPEICVHLFNDLVPGFLIVLKDVHTVKWCNHKRRIYTLTEEKTKVVAAVWGTEFIRILAALAILHQNDMKKEINCTRMIWRKGWIHPLIQIVLVQNT